MPKEAIHPGEILADELKEIGITATELSRRIAVPRNRVLAIIHRNRGITVDTALRLGRFFGTGPELWLNLQKAYDLDKAKSALGAELNRIPRWQSQTTHP